MKVAQAVRIVLIIAVCLINCVTLNGQSVKTEHEIKFQNWMNPQHSISILPSMATIGQFKLVLPPLLPSVSSFLAVGAVNENTVELTWLEGDFMPKSGFIGSPTTFIGTTNASPLKLFTDNTERFRITETGKFLFNDSDIDDSVLVQINGDVAITQDLIVKGNVVSNNVSILPAGVVMEYAGANEPSGWLICDGRAVSRTTYKELFAAIGTLYGNGDGTTTFNIPDLSGKVAIGASDAYPLASTGGEAEHTLTVDEIPAHKHTVKIRNSGNTSVPDANTTVLSGRVYDSKFNTPNFDLHQATISNTGGGQPHNNMQPYISLNYIIKY